MIRIDKKLLNSVSDMAKSSERKRMNHNFHKSLSDPVNRMLNAIEPVSYLCPHKHENPDKRETFIILKGRMLIVEFDDIGCITDFEILDPDNGNFGVEIPVGKWHTIISLKKDSVAYELKDGPYNPENDKIFVPWAPREGDKNASEFNQKILKELKIT